MPPSEPPVAVVGATGQQGGAVVRALAGAVPVRAIVRNPRSERAQALAAGGAEIATADLDDGDALRRALDGVSALFAMTTFFGESGVAGEVEHGFTMVDAAVDAAVPRVVYSSVGGAERGTGVPHFESKFRVEERWRASGVPTTVVRPTFFMENLADALDPALGATATARTLRLPMPADVPVQMIAVADIGRVAAAALLDPGRVPSGAIEIAGDECTGTQIAKTIAEVTGVPTSYEEVPVGVLDDDLRAMFTWLASPPAYRADLAATEALAPDPTTLARWVTAART